MAIDFSARNRIATDTDTSITTCTVTMHPKAQSLDLYATVAGTFKPHADDAAVMLPAASWTRVWDKAPGLVTTPTVLVTLGSSGDLHAKQN